LSSSASPENIRRCVQIYQWRLKNFLHTHGRVKNTQVSHRYDVIQTHQATKFKQDSCIFMSISVCGYIYHPPIFVSPGISGFMETDVDIDNSTETHSTLLLIYIS
jgi:hypothetical protein